MKKVYLIHGWDGFPTNHWFPWLKKELEKLNFKVESLKMPNSKRPKLNEWLEHLNKSIEPSKDTYLVGHSLSCITIVRYLESLPKNKKIDDCVFVARFSFLDIEEIKEFYKKDFDLNKIKEHCNKFVNIYSDNDEDVPIKQSEYFADLLEAKKILEKGKGHFCLEEGVDTLPNALEAVKEMQ